MKELTVTFYPKNSQQVLLTCEVAKSILEKEIGLMYRNHLDEDKGMIFPFLFNFHRLFWMRNVKIPLDIIFVDNNFRVSKIFEAPANVRFWNKRFWSHGFCKYVIETNMGFCKKHKIEPGAKINLR